MISLLMTLVYWYVMLHVIIIAVGLLMTILAAILKGIAALMGVK